jgi:hypothetical protein
LEDGTLWTTEIYIADLPPEEDIYVASDSYDGGQEFGRWLRGQDDEQFQPTNSTDEDESDNSFNMMNGVTEEWIIDVMVPYTQRTLCAIAQARSPKRCVPNVRRKRLVETRIQLAIQEANVAYRNSGIPGRLRLVHSYMIPSSDYDEQNYSKYSDILRSIAFPNDGMVDDVHALRLQYRADVVTFLVDHPASCGLAYTGNPVSRTWAFSVVNWICATGYYSFVHEISHNLGGRHDRLGEDCANSVDQCCEASGECDRYGWQDPEQRFRSVMAYNCPGPGGCPRVQYFSQPSINFDLVAFDGSVTEVPMGDNYNNNARGIASGFMAISAYLEHIDIDPQPAVVPPNVCGNGICEPDSPNFEENCETCPEDCRGGTFQVEECGNGICEVGEDCLNCAQDCAQRLNVDNDAYKYCCVGGPPEDAAVIALSYVDFGFPCRMHPNCNFNSQCSERPLQTSTYCCGNGICEMGEAVWSCPADCPCVDDGVCDTQFEDASCIDCQQEFIDHKPVLRIDSEPRCMKHGRVCSAIQPDPCCGQCNHSTHRCET